MSLDDGFVIPFVSVYGRSGSGKSTLVKFVCKKLSDLISFEFVNLRKARTLFGCANMILSCLDHQTVQSADGLGKAIDCMESQIQSIIESSKKKCFVLVLDEYDVIFSDSRGNPSDFVYNLLQMEENLQEKGLWTCIVAISNNALQEYDLDDRVKSRMGSTEIHFAPYSKNDILGIIDERAKHAFKAKPGDDVLEYCAHLASTDHDDAGRALDLLRVAGELSGGTVKKDVNKAQKIIQKDRIDEIIKRSSYHTRCVVGAVCALAIVNQSPWNATSEIYKKYSDIASKETPLKYRRVYDLLVELENTGVLVSRAYSRGRNGYGKEYKIKIDPDIVGPAVDQKFYESLIEKSKIAELAKDMLKQIKKW